MKILLRNYKDEQYVWKTAKHNGKTFIVDDLVVYYDNVVSVVNDNRLNCVTCSACGELFKKDSKKIEKHRNRHMDKDACIKCKHMRIQESTKVKSHITVTEDGSFVRKIEESLSLGCNYRRFWGSIDVNSEEAKRNCVVKACSMAEMKPFKDIFTEFPGVFDDVATVDRIIDVGYKEMKRYDKELHYKLKGGNQILAIVNNLGIIDSFVVSYQNEQYVVYYSKKYNRLYTYDGHYRPLEDCVFFPTKTMQYIKQKISEFYN